MLPMVHASIAWAAGSAGRPKQSVTPFESNLWIALSEIIPAALNSKRLHFAPSGISLDIDYKFRPWFRTDIGIVIEDYDSSDSTGELENRVFNIILYLRKLIPDTTFDVRISPGHFVRASDVNDPMFDGDMSLEAAYIRAVERMKRPT